MKKTRCRMCGKSGKGGWCSHSADEDCLLSLMSDEASDSSQVAGSLSGLASLYLEENHVSGDSMIDRDHSLEGLKDDDLGAFDIADLMSGFAEKMMKENRGINGKSPC